MKRTSNPASDAYGILLSYSAFKTDRYAKYSSISHDSKYSKEYVTATRDKFAEEVLTKRANALQDLKELVSAYENEQRHAIASNGISINSTLLQFLQSPIKKTPDVYKELAQIYSVDANPANYWNARMIHDAAEKDGYKVNNLRSQEEKIKALERIARRIERELRKDNFMTTLDTAIVEMAIAEDRKQFEELKPEEITVSASIEEEIANDIAQKRQEQEIELSQEDIDKIFGVERAEIDAAIAPEVQDLISSTFKDRNTARQIVRQIERWATAPVERNADGAEALKAIADSVKKTGNDETAKSIRSIADMMLKTDEEE